MAHFTAVRTASPVTYISCRTLKIAMYVTLCLQLYCANAFATCCTVLCRWSDAVCSGSWSRSLHLFMPLVFLSNPRSEAGSVKARGMTLSRGHPMTSETTLDKQISARFAYAVVVWFLGKGTPPLGITACVLTYIR